MTVTFTLLPAVDVAGGRAVRLVGGDAATATSHGDPRDTALAWQRDGATWIHLVDLDAAFGRGSNADLLGRIVDELDVNVQLSGGICDDRSLERALSTGCARVNLATQALDDLDWCARVIATYRDRISVSLDVLAVSDGTGVHHRLAARGGSGNGGDLVAAIVRLDEFGCARYVVTDVGVDGSLRGPNLELYRAVTRATSTPVIASGGISAIDDLVALVDLASSAAGGAGVDGAIVGMALSAGRFTLAEALQAVEQRAVSGRAE